MTIPAISMYDWHHRPKGRKDRRCPICDAPSGCYGEHRATEDADGINYRWLRRLDSGELLGFGMRVDPNRAIRAAAFSAAGNRSIRVAQATALGAGQAVPGD